MGITIIPIGGHLEIGKNCTAVKVDDEVVLLALGLHLDNYIKFTEEREHFVKISSKQLMSVKAVPDVSKIKELHKQVKAICATHAHLDHVGAIPFLASKFDCDVHASPFTIALLKTLIKDHRTKLSNKLIAHGLHERFKISDKIEIEFLNMPHSTPQTLTIAIHTPYGTVLYANEFKFDDTPTLGEGPSREQMKNMQVKVAIVESLYAPYSGKCPSEQEAQKMLEKLMVEMHHEGHAIVITTFASHIARLKSIIELSKKINRKPVLIGRSLSKYVTAAQDIGIIDFSDVEMVRFGSKVKRFFSKIKNSEEYVFIVTGHQGEPRAVLSRMVKDGFFHFDIQDKVIFSCQVIPTRANIENREKLEESLKEKDVTIYSDIHTSGHARQGDYKELITLTKPEVVIPTHGNKEMEQAFQDYLVDELKYDRDKVPILRNFEEFEIE